MSMSSSVYVYSWLFLFISHFVFAVFNLVDLHKRSSVCRLHLLSSFTSTLAKPSCANKNTFCLFVESHLKTKGIQPSNCPPGEQPRDKPHSLIAGGPGQQRHFVLFFYASSCLSSTFSSPAHLGSGLLFICPSLPPA